MSYNNVLTRFYDNISKEIGEIDIKGLLSSQEIEEVWDIYKDIIVGVPDDFILLFLPEGKKATADVLLNFYAPLPLSLMVLKKGVEEGVFQIEEGALRLLKEVKEVPLSEVITIEQYEDYNPLTKSQAQAVSTLIQNLSLVKKSGEKASILNLSTSFNVKANDKGELLTIPQDADILFARGIPFGVYDCVIADIISDFEEAICDAISANLKPYGSALVCYTPLLYDNEELGLIDLMKLMERSSLFVTDIIRKKSVFAIRAVKYPELFTLRTHEED